MAKDELIREIQLKRQLSELDGSPVPEYDPSDGMETVEELKRYVRFLYSSLQEKDSNTFISTCQQKCRNFRDFFVDYVREWNRGRRDYDNLVRLAFSPATN